MDGGTGMAVRALSLVANGSDTAEVLADLDRQLAASDIDPDFVVALYSVSHDDTLIHRFLRRRLPHAALTGGSSGRGMLSDRGISAERAIGLWLVEDPDGRYGAAGVELLSSDPASVAAAAADALERALDAADATGELPDLIWVYQTCGLEDLVLDGLRTVVGDRCPVVGASAADDDESGSWRELGPDGPLTRGLAIAALFPSGGVGVAYQGGFEPTGNGGVATFSGDGITLMPFVPSAARRHIGTIDGRPAAEVYADWVRAEFPSEITDPEELIEAHGSEFAFGIPTGEAGVVTHYRLVQPIAVSPGGGLVLAADIAEGSPLYAMRGSRGELVRRAGRVVSTAVSYARQAVETAEIAGALMVYCNDCRTAVGDDIVGTADMIGQALGGRPFLSCFSGGEQGPAFGRNVHANLMISAIVFGG